MTQTLLHFDASARKTGSVSRDLSRDIVARLSTQDTHVIRRDLADTDLPFVDESWIGANFTPEDDRTDAQRETLSLSDNLIAELEAADTIVIGVPIYNFGVPAAFKAWVDQVARARKTFRYTEAGPEGLLKGKRAVVALASGGTKSGSEIDFATGYVRHVLGFMGITDVEFVAADQLMLDAEGTRARADAAVGALEVRPALAA